LKTVYAIVGPTASGKTLIGIEIAKHINAEIISADSRQVYKDIQIATAAPTISEMDNIKHYFINELDISVDFNSGDFANKAKMIIADIQLRNKKALIVGGSGLYLKALIDGFFKEEIKDEKIRKNLNERLAREGKEALYSELQNIDSLTASKMDSDKSRRVIRALEVYYSSGITISELQANTIKPDFATIQVGLLWKREDLYDRINKRVNNMFDNGLIKEVKALMDKNYHYKKNNSLNTVGIKEVMMYLEKEISFDEMVNLIKQNTRRYAKRQMTWFNKDKRIQWVECSEMNIESVPNLIIRKYFS